MTALPTEGYDAFISYSHAGDGRLAPQLQSGLQRFGKPWWRRRILRIFRDETGLSANPHLWSSIEIALASSEWFILLASPAAARSEWVAREIEWWLDHKQADHIIPIVTDGEFHWNDETNELDPTRSTAMPPVIAAAFSDEPRWLDLRWAHSQDHLDLRNVRFREALADIAAPLHGRPKDELESEEIRQHRRTVRTAVAAIILLGFFAVAASVGGLVAVRQRDRAEENALVAQARAVAGQAVANSSVRLDRALLLGAYAVQLNDDFETRRGLLEVLDTAGPLLGHRAQTSGTSGMTISPDGSQLTTVSVDGLLQHWSTDDWVVLLEGTAEDIINPYSVNYSTDGAVIEVVGENGTRLFRSDDFSPSSPLLTVPGAPFVAARVNSNGHSFVATDLSVEVIVGRVDGGEQTTQFESGCPWPQAGIWDVIPGPENLVMVACAAPGFAVHEIDPESGRPALLYVDEHQYSTTSLFSPDATKLLLSNVSGDATIVDARNGDVLARLELPAERVYSASFDASSRYLAVGGDNGTIALWDLEFPEGVGQVVKRVRTLTGLEEGVVGVAFLAVDAGSDAFPLESAAIRLATATSSGITEWDLSRLSVLVDPVQSDGFESLRIDPSSQVLYTSSTFAPTIEALSVGSDTASRLIEILGVDGISDTSLSADGERLLVVSGTPPEILDEGSELSGAPSEQSEVAPTRLLVVATDDGSVVREIDVPPDVDIVGGWWSPDEQRLATTDGVSIVVLDLANGGVADVSGPERFTRLGWSSTGELMAAGYTGTLTFLDPAGLDKVAELRLTPGFTLVDIDESADGLMVVTSESGEVFLIDPVTHETVGEPYRWGGTQLQQGAISADGLTVAALSRDGSIRLWDGPSRLPLAPALRAHTDAIFFFSQLAFLADGTLVTSSGGSILHWNLDSARLIATACRLAGRELSAEEWRTFVDREDTPTPICG